MKRIISIWLPRWPSDRLLISRARKQGKRRPDPAWRAEPLALTAGVQGGVRLRSVNEAAASDGLRPGMNLADARALVPNLHTIEARPLADREGLERLSDWCGRFSPWTARNGEDSIWIDATGCAHLFGGEEAMLRILIEKLTGFGIEARAAMAETPGAAWAVARFGCARHDGLVVAPGSLSDTLAGLPPAALRLDEGITSSLAHLGLKTIADLYHMPRAALTRRFGPVLLTRLDQALGREEEPISPKQPLTPYRTRLSFAEPVGTPEDIAEGLRRLLEEMQDLLKRDGHGVRELVFTLYRTDGTLARTRIGTSRPRRDSGHLFGLFREKLDDLDPGFGIEAMMLDAPLTERILPAVLTLTEEGHARSEEELSRLIDKLGNRLGRDNIARFAHYDSHIPEKAEGLRSALADTGAAAFPAPLPACRAVATVTGAAARPFRLLPRPEPVEVVAEVPEGPPQLFRWRRVAYRVLRAEGPERIAPEWWHVEDGRNHTRDYYRIEDIAGRRFWLYRDGLYHDALADPCWFVHGVFA